MPLSRETGPCYPGAMPEIHNGPPRPDLVSQQPAPEVKRSGSAWKLVALLVVLGAVALLATWLSRGA